MHTRVLALGSLLAVVVALGAIVTAQGTPGEAYREALAGRFAADGRALDALGGELAALTPGASPAAAKAALRRAVASHDAVARWVATTLPGDDWPLSSRADVAVRRQAAFLDAVGSVLNNPGSPLLATAAGRAGRLREALGALRLRGVRDEVVRGEDALAAHARARLR